MEKEIEFLRKIGCEEIPHDSRNLLTHLIGVYKLLYDYGRPEHEQRAGLFHAIYGTEFYTPGLVITREVVKKNIGEEAEEIVYNFCETRGERRMRFMGGIEFKEPLKTSLRWLDFCNIIEQHNIEGDIPLQNVVHVYETVLNISKRL